MDLTKIEVVMNWPKPMIVMEIRSFLGLASYYHRFVDKFFGKATPFDATTEQRGEVQMDR